MAYWQLEPFGSIVDDHRAEVQAYLFYSAHSKPGSKVPRFFERDPAEKPKRKVPKRVNSNKLERDFMAVFGRRIVEVPPETTDSPALPIEPPIEPTPDK